MNLKRSPDGRFIAPEAALEAWLPKMLDWKFGDSARIADALLFIAKYCDQEVERYNAAHAKAKRGDIAATLRFRADCYMEQAALIREVAEKCR